MLRLGKGQCAAPVTGAARCVNAACESLPSVMCVKAASGALNTMDGRRRVSYC